MTNYSSTMGRHFESTMKGYIATSFARADVKADRLAGKMLKMTRGTAEFEAAAADLGDLLNEMDRLRASYAGGR